MRARKSVVLLLVVSGLLPGISACRDRDEAPKYRTLKGRVTGINLTSGEVEMDWYNPKEKKDRRLKGKLAPDAEILIDGSTARLEDVRTDDQVTVEGRIEKRDGDPQLVAIKVRITRDATSAPASQPSTTPESRP